MLGKTARAESLENQGLARPNASTDQVSTSTIIQNPYLKPIPIYNNLIFKEQFFASTDPDFCTTEALAGPGEKNSHRQLLHALLSIACSRRDLPPPSVESSIACSRRDLPRHSLGSYLLHPCCRHTITGCRSSTENSLPKLTTCGLTDSAGPILIIRT
jgi:hypothetical protein